MVLPVIGERFVEGRILFIGHIFRLAHPKWLVLVELFPFMRNLLHLLSFLLLLLLLLIFVDFLNLWLVVILLVLFFVPLVLILRIGDFSFDFSTQSSIGSQ